MGKTAEEVVMGLATTVFGMDEQGVSALREADGSFKDDAPDVLRTADAQRIAKVKTDAEKALEKQREKDLAERFSLGKKDGLTKLEQSIRDKFGIQSEKMGLELVEELIQSKQPKGEPMTEEGIKKHPLYRAVEQQLQAKEQEFTTTLDTKLKEKDAEHNRERVLALVVEDARVYLDSLRPILPEDPVQRANQIKWFENAVRSFNYQVDIDSGGKRTLLMLDKDGNRLNDAHSFPVKVSEKWKEIASQYWPFQASDERSSAGSADKGTTTTAKNGALVIKKPANKQEYNETLARILDEVKDPKERATATLKLKELHAAG